MPAVMLTTKDNPFDPFDQFDQWYAYDQQMGYGTCEIIDRLARTSPDLTPEENLQELNEVIDDIIAEFFFIDYVKVTRKS